MGAAAQAQVVQQVPHTGLVVSIDTTDGFNLHPGEKGEIGRRAALQAERLAYGQDVVADGPTLKSATVDNGTVRVTFDTHDGPLKVHGSKLLGFSLAGADGQYRFADATVAGDDSVVVGSPDVPDPRTVRYGWAAVPTGNLYNAAGLPAGPFRTDDQPPSVPVEIEPVIPGRQVTTDRYSATIDGYGSLTSMGVDGQQFISNDVGGLGTANFTAMFGPRHLQHRTDLSAGQVRYTDNDLSLTYAFSPLQVAISIQNHGKGKVTYRLPLAHTVQVTPSGAGEAELTLKRGTATVKLLGADKFTKDAQGGGTIDATVDGGTTKTLTFEATRPG